MGCVHFTWRVYGLHEAHDGLHEAHDGLHEVSGGWFEAYWGLIRSVTVRVSA